LTLSVGSLFSGIGGFDLGLERAGMQVVWQVENDPFCNKVLAKHWPDVQQFGDIKDCGKHNLEPVDLICGGFPCQDVSLAGKRKGLEGERSGLWSEYARIVRELRPRYVLVENVPGLLSSGFGRVLGDLAESGYDAEWDCIPAAFVGAPHLRNRVWIVAYASQIRCNTRRPQQPLQGPGAPGPPQVADAQGVRWQVPGDKEKWRICFTKGPDYTTKPTGISDTDSKRLQISGNPRTLKESETRIFEGATINRSNWWTTEPDVGRVAHGVPARVDRLRSLGNAIVPQIAEFIGRQIMKYEEPTWK
jgi:DNA (cytosine-5)-methyltransferase 1